MSCGALWIQFRHHRGAESMTLVRPWRDARLASRVGGALVAGCAGLLMNRPSLIVVAAGLGMATAVGLRQTGSIDVGIIATFDSEQVVEDDHVHGSITISRPADIALDVFVDPSEGMTVIEPLDQMAWHIPAGDAVVNLPFQVIASRWGRHRIGTVHVRATVPGSLLTWEGPVEANEQLNVMPASERLDRLLRPRASRTTSGAHHSRAVGDGLDFAEIRAYAPGDRLRDLNWAASARGGGPMINRRHPERAGEVVVLVDTAADAFDQASVAGRATLAHMARAAWAVASVHSASQDRVGFLAFGRVGGWLTPAAGRHARYRLLDSLLAVGGAVAAKEAVAPPDPHRVISPAALVIGVTPLTTHLIVDTLMDLKARGRAVVCVVPQLADAGITNSLALALWSAGIQNRMLLLQEVGIPVAAWPNGTPIGPVIEHLRRAQRHQSAVRGR